MQLDIRRINHKSPLRVNAIEFDHVIGVGCISRLNKRLFLLHLIFRYLRNGTLIGSFALQFLIYLFFMLQYDKEMYFTVCVIAW